MRPDILSWHEIGKNASLLGIHSAALTAHAVHRRLKKMNITPGESFAQHDHDGLDTSVE